MQSGPGCCSSCRQRAWARGRAAWRTRPYARRCVTLSRRSRFRLASGESWWSRPLRTLSSLSSRSSRRRRRRCGCRRWCWPWTRRALAPRTTRQLRACCCSAASLRSRANGRRCVRSWRPASPCTGPTWTRCWRRRRGRCCTAILTWRRSLRGGTNQCCAGT